MQRVAHLSLAGLLTLVAVSLTACSDRVTSPADSDLIEVRVSPPWQSVAVGNTVQFTASMDAGASVTRTVKALVRRATPQSRRSIRPVR